MTTASRVGAALLGRRRFLRGTVAGSAVAIGLPLLDCLFDESGTALAATGAAPPPCFGTWVWGCGLTPGRWEPAAVGKIAELSPELKLLERFKSKINVYSGLKVHLDGKTAINHFTGTVAMLTGNTPRQQTVGLPTVDVLVGRTIGTTTRFRSVEVADTGNPKHGFSFVGDNVLNPAEASPLALYARLFGPEFKDPNAAEFVPDPLVMARQSVLSGVTEQRADVLQRLGAADRSRIDEYFTSLRQLEQQLALQLEKPAPLEACSVSGKPAETETGADIERVRTNNKLFSGLLAHALACDQTRVINISFGDGASTLRHAGSQMTHHIYTHEEPIDRELGYQINATWFNEQIIGGFADTLAALESIKEGDRTLLDRTLMMTATDTGYAKLHSYEKLPMLTAGSGGGRLKTGLHVAAHGDPVTRVGLTVQQALGVPVSSWGTEGLATGRPFSEVLA